MPLFTVPHPTIVGNFISGGFNYQQKLHNAPLRLVYFECMVFVNFKDMWTDGNPAALTFIK